MTWFTGIAKLLVALRESRDSLGAMAKSSEERAVLQMNRKETLHLLQSAQSVLRELVQEFEQLRTADDPPSEHGPG